MRLSQIFTRTTKDASREDVSKNAQLLTRAGYINKLMAGVYSFLPLGLRVLAKIEDIIREEMNAVGGQEILMPALHPKEIWEQTKRWDKVDILFKLKGAGDRDLCLGPTHEEVVTPLVTSFIQSYRDLPQAVYQIQTKFRNEARAKSGLLRGREFRMKDLYSFHTTEADLSKYYDRVTEAYHRIYDRCGIGQHTLLTFASGGIFSKYSHEFQTVTESGEDIVYQVPGTKIAINKEIIDDVEALKGIIPNYKPGDEKNLTEVKAIEVGNIFKLATRFADDFGATYADEESKPQKIWMGCYGLGPSRLMGSIVECLADDKGLVWPEQIAPYQVHLVSLANEAEDINACDKIYDQLLSKKIEVLYDDRSGFRAGEKFADADLIGIPHRLVVSAKTLKANQVEYKARTGEAAQMMSLEDFINTLKS